MDIQDKRQYEKPQEKVVSETEARHKVWIGSYGILALGCLTVWFLLRLHVFEVLRTYLPLFKKAALAAFFVFLILLAGRCVQAVMTKRTQVRAVRYNLVRLIRLLTALLIILVIVSFLFENWYTAAVSLGLISLILGFALQTPISSFIGWLYIIFRNPYRVGDRIQIDTFKGDVVEVNYLDTTLWEFGGDYLSNDLPTGRLIRFPNSLVLQEAVYNYSWQKFPFIWNEIPFHVAYGSDFSYVETVLKTVTKGELGAGMAENVQHLKDLIAQTPVDELEIREYPFVCFRINANTWVEAQVIYLVEPRHAASIRSRIIKKAIAELLKEPDKVMFPKGDSR